MESQSSGDTGVKEESSGLDFGDFVIKQEVGDVDENVEGGDEDDDLYFTGESFEEQPPYQMGMPGPSGAGGGMEQVSHFLYCIYTINTRVFLVGPIRLEFVYVSFIVLI